MMYPRLKLARNLLKEDGLIFISIDENEVHNLRKICDEIFGESNFFTEVVWKQWKRIRTKMSNLVKLGVDKQKAWEWSNTRNSYWHTASSWILSTTITRDRLRQAGYLYFTDYYQKVRIKT